MKKKQTKNIPFHPVGTIPQYIIETGVKIDTPNTYFYCVSRNLFQNGNVKEISYTICSIITYTSNSGIDVVMAIIIIIFIFSFLNRIPLICSINKMI